MTATFSKPAFIAVFIISAAAIFSFALVAGASIEDVKYPVKELGNCKNEAECLKYCDERENLERVKACLDFAKRYELLSPEEIEEAEYYALTLGVTKGPGGCADRNECEAFCEDTGNLDECLDFAEKYSLRPAEEIADGRKMAKALAAGADLPGGCKTRAECEAYCESPTNMRACVDFGKKYGFISDEEASQAEKIIPLLARGEKTPGNCGRKEACEQYCQEAGHIDECIAFAEKAGLLPPDELEDAKKFSRFIKSGETPGGCRSRAECEAYCADADHFDECVSFGEKAGLMSVEDAELARRVKGFGPGECLSREECDAFCRNPANEDECLNFAEEHGLDDIAAEIQEEVREEIEAEAGVCLAKPNCQELVSCLQGITERTGRGGEFLSETTQQKLNACVAEITEELQGRGAGVKDDSPQQQNSGKEYQKQYDAEYQKEYERQYQEEYERQVKEETERRIKEETERQLRQFQQLPQ